MAELGRNEAIAAAALSTRRLANGLTAIAWSDPRDVVVSTQVWVRTGSSREDPGCTGVAHMLEHLMFRGTPAVPDGELDRRMESLGASINAVTWLDYTAYLATAPAESLAGVLALEADRFAGLALTDAVFTAERSVVANERRQVVDADPVAVFHERLAARAQRGSPYEWPTIGWAEHIEAFSLDAVEAFRRRFYAPSNCAVVVCGPLDGEEMLDAIEASFGGLQGPEAPADDRVPTRLEPCDETHRYAIASPRLVVCWPAPAVSAPEHAAWSVLVELLGGGESSRLPERLEVREKVALDADIALGAHALPSLLSLEVTMRPRASFDGVLAAVDEELDALARRGPEAGELRRARMRMRTADALALATTGARAERVGEGWAVVGDPLALFRVADRTGDVSPDEVRDAARALRKSPRCVFRAKPEAA